MRRRFIYLVAILSIALFSCRKEMSGTGNAAASLVNTVTGTPALVAYDESKVLRVPGNYQNWNVPAAPQLVSANGNGEYEGYIYFNLSNTQFWMVKGTNWDNVTTYNQTGSQTFGHNGTYFTLPDGAGVYRVTANTNNFTWAAKKIRTWAISGSAAGGQDVELTADASGLTWSVTRSFSAGTFVFRANGSDEIVFGHNGESTSGVPDYNGEKIQLAQAGSYTITLSLQKAGNYTYTIRRNS